MKEDKCFICATRVGRGNQPSQTIDERMSKLISVSRNVEHSSTIISDILSRILNETVMREEIICRLCFNLLTDIDYHLKEAQEKTDEITNKFLDKNKSPLQVSIAYHPSEPDPLETEPKDVKKKSKKRKIPAKVYDTEAFLTEDEMSVNTINRKKAKVLNHVWNPMRQKQQKQGGYVDETEESEDETTTTNNVKGVDKENKKKSQKKIEMDTTSDDSESEYSLSDETEEDRSIKQKNQKKKKKKNGRRQELSTVNTDDLDLVSKPKYFYATKSDPKQKNSSGNHSQSQKKGQNLTKAQQQYAEINRKPMSEEGLVNCDMCSKTFKRKTNLQLHIEKVHSPIAIASAKFVPETHKCDFCPREFTNEMSLANHKKEHNHAKKNGKSSPEKHVPVSTSDNSQARDCDDAVGVAENNKPEYKATCPYCKKNFRRTFNMRLHVDRVHNKLKPFKCKTCDKTFATNSDLKQHLPVHGEGKTFECETCGRHFTNRDSIILHRKKHTNQKTHFCTICSKGFFKASCVSRHMRTHDGSKPYSCEHCQKSFGQASTLKTHMAKCQK